MNSDKQTTFYVTDSGALRNQVLYFRQDDWRMLCKPLIERLQSVTFTKMDKVRIMLRSNYCLRYQTYV